MANLIVGNDGANALPGTTGRDVILSLIHI